MQFHLSSNGSPPKGQFLLGVPEGGVVAYEEPLRARLFWKLGRAIVATKWARKFDGRFYRLKSNSGFLETAVPASEYYKISFRAMNQKYHGILGAHESIDRVVSEISQKFAKGVNVRRVKNQAKLKLDFELYELRASVSAYLFLVRSLLDQFAALIQFLSGPGAKQFKGFTDVINKAASVAPPPELTPDLCGYLQSELSWYNKLKDFRDFIAHHGFVPFRIVEANKGQIRVFVHYRIDLLILVDEIQGGLDALLEFLDDHYAEKVKNA